MLEGKRVNLRLLEKEDVSTLADWVNDIRVSGAYAPMTQDTKASIEKDWLESTSEKRWFAVETKDGEKAGVIGHFPSMGCQEIGFAIIPDKRGKGCCSDAARVLVDFLFLSKDVQRIQATCDVDNEASRRVLEKAGFIQEGTLRKSMFINGRWRDRHIYSVLRSEWTRPSVLELP
jgi:ribosomal-protein-alanine N-acetyltransferase